MCQCEPRLRSCKSDERSSPCPFDRSGADGIIGAMKLGWMSARPHFVPCIAGAVAAFVAVARMPYGYYTLVRLVVCATFVFVVVMAAMGRQMWAVWVCIIFTLLFNPIVPVHLTRSLWQPLDFIAGATLVAAAFVVHSRPQPGSH